MMTFLLSLSASLTIIVGLLLLFNKISTRYRLGALIFTLLFFSVFLYSMLMFFDARSFFTKKEVQIQELPAGQQTNSLEASNQILKKSVLLDAPIESQLPELPRGCEVTSLSMLLQFKGIKIDKMKLAELIRKDLTPYQVDKGNVYFGHPNDGFVGDMYNIDNPGYGVYHKPVKELAERFLPGEVVDLTGKDFGVVEGSVSKGNPVWIIINTRYKALPPEEFEIWDTPKGKISITYREHSVLVTGYDKKYIYFNDPLSGEKNKKAPRQDFIEAWVQMGKQAISYTNQ